MRLAHHADPVSLLRKPTASDPLRVLVSACLTGRPCGTNGTDYGLGGCLRDLLELPVIAAVTFCPEEHAIGTPRTMPDLHGGDGHAVVDGRARVLDEHGLDLTEKMLAGARAMLDFARAERVELALLTDMSGACGSQVISDGCRYDDPRRFQAGVGVATALLLREGIPLVSQRDYRTLGLLRAYLDPSYQPDPAARDHHQSDWYLGYFRG